MRLKDLNKLEVGGQNRNRKQHTQFSEGQEIGRELEDWTKARKDTRLAVENQA